MKKEIVIILLFAMTYHAQNFCPRGPNHHLKRLNAPRHWMRQDLHESPTRKAELQQKMREARQRIAEKQQKGR
ncbi:MAG TPA: hypothetical protein VKU36_02740 [Candidatus Babeliales bacterium]|nr:hypothetical protein [Candidatus Babeliales bacterium]